MQLQEPASERGRPVNGLLGKVEVRDLRRLGEQDLVEAELRRRRVSVRNSAV